jgi:hypothetical protein
MLGTLRNLGRSVGGVQSPTQWSEADHNNYCHADADDEEHGAHSVGVGEHAGQQAARQHRPEDEHPTGRHHGTDKVDRSETLPHAHRR